MNILDRIRAGFLRRELMGLLDADRQARDVAETTDDMMAGIVKRASRIAELRNRIRVLEGIDDEPEDSGFGDARIPSSLFIPSKQDPP